MGTILEKYSIDPWAPQLYFSQKIDYVKGKMQHKHPIAQLNTTQPVDHVLPIGEEKLDKPTLGNVEGEK